MRGFDTTHKSYGPESLRPDSLLTEEQILSELWTLSARQTCFLVWGMSTMRGMKTVLEMWSQTFPPSLSKVMRGIKATCRLFEGISSDCSLFKSQFHHAYTLIYRFDCLLIIVSIPWVVLKIMATALVSFVWVRASVWVSDSWLMPLQADLAQANNWGIQAVWLSKKKKKNSHKDKFKTVIQIGPGQ